MSTSLASVRGLVGNDFTVDLDSSFPNLWPDRRNFMNKVIV